MWRNTLNAGYDILHIAAAPRTARWTCPDYDILLHHHVPSANTGVFIPKLNRLRRHAFLYTHRRLFSVHTGTRWLVPFGAQTANVRR